jgi:hypothetical protein
LQTQSKIVTKQETIFYTATKNAAEANCEANEDNTAPIITTCELK